MARPTIALILDTLAERVAAVRSPDYASTVTSVLRAERLHDYTPTDGLVAIDWLGAEVDDSQAHEGHGPAVAWRHTVELSLHARPSAAAALPIDERLLQFVSDVAAAITAPDRWETFGELATFAELVSQTRFTTDDQIEGVLLVLEITCQVDETDWTQAR